MAWGRMLGIEKGGEEEVEVEEVDIEGGGSLLLMV